jgi:hypothetical protein
MKQLCRDPADDHPDRAAVSADPDGDHGCVCLLDLVEQAANRGAGQEPQTRWVDLVDGAVKCCPCRRVQLFQDVAHRPAGVDRRVDVGDRGEPQSPVW